MNGLTPASFEITNLQNILNELSTKRKVFHSEADFQHALAICTHEQYPDINIRLEKRFDTEIINDKDKSFYLDIVLIYNNINIGIELKYKTKAFKCNDNGEEFDLKNADAHDCACFDFREDIFRLEYLKKKEQIQKGYVVFLTNDSNYFIKKKNNKTSMYENIKIYEDKIIEKKTDWNIKSEATSSIAQKKLDNEYICKWEKYSTIESQEFKYLLLEV